MRTLSDTESVGPAAHSRPGALSRVAANAVALTAVLSGKALIGLGLRRPPEGWRRTVGILLRSESTRFALSSFGLRVPGAAVPGHEGRDALEERTARGLLEFFAGEPDAHFALEWRTHVTIRRPLRHVDIAVLHFGADGRLEEVEPYLAAGGPAAPTSQLQTAVHAAVVAAYNRTARLPEVHRPHQLRDQVRGALSGDAAAFEYAQRVLSACCLSFEPLEPSAEAARFRPPDFVARRTLGFGYLSCVARLHVERGVVDLWVSAHHVGLDGVPLQDLLGRLEQAWGTEAVTFPAALEAPAFAAPRACHAPRERPVDFVHGFVDLSPVVELRRRLCDEHATAVGGDITLGAVIAWLLGLEPEFRGVRIASTVDVKASGGYDRDVDVVPLRPADFAAGPGEWDGFVEFAREFNRLIAASRTRTSPLRAGMQTAGLLPAWAHATAVRSNPASLDDTFGSLCVTIVREARVFIAPMTDLGLGHGFIAIGSAGLPSVDGGRVASVSIKGDAGRIGHYPAVLQRVLARAATARGGQAP